MARPVGQASVERGPFSGAAPAPSGAPSAPAPPRLPTPLGPGVGQGLSESIVVSALFGWLSRDDAELFHVLFLSRGGL